MNGHEIIRAEEVQVFRNPSAYIEWFDGLLLAIRDDPSIKEPARRHEGVFKKFYEEMFPLVSLLKVKKEKWRESEFRSVFGNQNYDVEIRSNALMFLEVVTTDFDDGELFRGGVLTARGSVDAIAPVVRDERGRPIGFENEGDCRLHDNVVSEVLTLAQSRLLAKCEKTYPAKTGLVINVDDYKTNPTCSDWQRFSTMLEARRPHWQPIFETVFVVGPRGQSCIELASVP